ncbi:MAG: DUF2183 domain-containing protein [Planctomycetes bacterium]|nr:DUF2183 domain-containing protein [Planctomycetota bacterium]
MGLWTVGLETWDSWASEGSVISRSARVAAVAVACLLAVGLALGRPAAAGDDAAPRLAVDLWTAHGAPQAFTVNGRVLYATAEPGKPAEHGGAWENLLATASALESDEVVGAAVTVRALGRELAVTTDRDGLFAARFVADAAAPFPAGLHPIAAVARDPRGALADATGRARVHVIAPDAPFGVISDLDDTIVQSEVTRKAMLLFNTFFKNAASMTPVAGTAALYRALLGLPPAAAAAESAAPPAALPARPPVFYLSASPINLHARLRWYLDLHAYPEGPVLLKNINLVGGDPLLDQTTYKLGRLRELFAAYPDLPFLLFGDSGERDPEVYGEIRKEFPGRVLFTGIRLCRAAEDPQAARFADTVPTRTSFDAARALCRAGRLTAEQAFAVARATAGVESLPADFDLDSALPAPLPPSGPAAVAGAAGPSTAEIWERLWSLTEANWSVWLAQAGKVLALALVGAFLGGAAGALAGLAGFWWVRRRGWTRTGFTWYRWVAWALPLWCAFALGLGGAWAGAFTGGYLKLRGYILGERQVQKLLLHVALATVMARDEYAAAQAAGGPAGMVAGARPAATGRKVNTEVKAAVQRKAEEFLERRPGAGAWERWCVRNLSVLFLGIADDAANLNLLEAAARLPPQELDAALAGDRTAAVKAGYTVLYDGLNRLDLTLAGWVRSLALGQAALGLLLALCAALAPLGALRLAERWWGRPMGAAEPAAAR